MKRSGLLLTLCFVMVGCQTLEHQRDLAKQTSNDNLCIATVTGTSNQKQAAGEELAQRQVSCDWQRLQPLLQAYMAQQAQYNLMLMQMAGQLQRTGQPYTLPGTTAPSTFRCVSTNTGANVITNCQ